jgi:hypothetical protein
VKIKASPPSGLIIVSPGRREILYSKGSEEREIFWVRPAFSMDKFTDPSFARARRESVRPF